MKVVVTNLFGPENLGDWELASRTLSITRDVLERQKDKVHLCAITRFPDECKAKLMPNASIEFYEQPGKVNGSSKILRLYFLLVAILVVLIPGATFLFPRRQQYALKSIRSSDLVVLCAGGYLEGTNRGYFWHLFQILYSVRCRRKIVSAPISVGSFDNRLARSIVKYTLSKVHTLISRDESTDSFFDANLLDFHRSTDLALDRGKGTLSFGESDYFVITAIDWPKAGPRKRQRRSTYIYSLAEIISTIYTKLGLRPVFLVQVNSDLTAINEVYRLLDESCSKMIKVCDNGPLEAHTLIEKSRFLIASRMHSSIFSINRSRMVYAISYLPKISSFFNEVGMSFIYEEFDALNVDTFLSKINSYSSISYCSNRELGIQVFKRHIEAGVK